MYSHIHVRTILCVGGTLTKCPAIESIHFQQVSVCRGLTAHIIEINVLCTSSCMIFALVWKLE